jgi:hypothetical protein
MNSTTTYETINFEKFLDRVNGYRFDFMDNTITGKLVAYNNGFLTVELRSGNVICAHQSTVKSIWNVHEKQSEV